MATDGAEPLEVAGEVSERAQFGNNCELILALVSFAVGLGNIWRFPYLVYDNGGGTFLVPYVFALFFLGIPLFVLELGMGQILRQGIINLWVKLGIPNVRGIGISATITAIGIGVYYMVIVTWTLFFLFQTIGAIGDGVVPWSDQARGFQCDPVVLVPSSSVVDNIDLFDNNTQLYNPKYKSMFACGDTTDADWSLPDDNFPVNGTDYSLVEVVPTVCPAQAAVKYFNDVVLEKSASITDWDGIHWGLVPPFTFCWLCAYILVFKGVALSGKLMYITSTTPYICLTAFFIRAVTLPNAGTGISYYVTPDFSALGNPVVWQRAATQIFFSLSLGVGGIVAFGSYGDKKADYPLHVLRVSFINCGTSIFAGFVVFGILGFLAEEMSNVNPCFSKDDVGLLRIIGISGPGLTFIAFPVAIAQMDGSFFWACLFFMMLFFLGIGSAFAFVEGACTVLAESGYADGRPRWQVAAFVCGASWLFGFTMFMNRAGEYWVTVFDTYVSVISLLFVGGVECVGIAWVNPHVWPNMVQHTKNITGRNIGWMTPVIKYISPLVMFTLIILSVTAFDLTGLEGDAKFPTAIIVFGWFLGLLPIAGFFFAFFLEPSEVPLEVQFTVEGGVKEEELPDVETS